MDNQFIDRLTRLLAATPNRRITLGLAASAAFDVLTGLRGLDEAEAGKRKKGGKKKGKKGKKPKNSGNQPPEGDFCGDRYCSPDQRCCRGECVDPSLCCTVNSDCNACSYCHLGRCEPDPTKNGTACAGCLECVNGACGFPNDEFCGDDEICRHSTGGCCRKCQDDQCCPVDSICINPGIFSPNFCCNVALNQPCGDNGDGTYRECCSNANEVCVDGECVPKNACGSGPSCNGRCCGENEFCNEDGICENPFACPRAHCSNRDLVCCPPNRFTNSAYCCPQGAFCRDTVVGCSSL